jgi:uncharacterized protein (DUF2164 family)
LSTTTRKYKYQNKKMVDHIETVDPEILNNFVSVALGLRFTVEGLQDVIVDSMATVHHNILTNIAAGVCTENCSRQHGRAFTTMTSCNPSTVKRSPRATDTKLFSNSGSTVSI